MVISVEKYGQIYTGTYTYIDPYNATYTVTISNTNTTSSAESIEVPYGGAATVTVTPDEGYYLSSVSCPGGYSCTYINSTDTQIIIITNKKTTRNGTLTFTATAASLSAMCNAVATESRFTYDGVGYLKLRTSATNDNTTACYTWRRRGLATWSDAASLCPDGTGIPTKDEAAALVDAYGSGSGLHLVTDSGWGIGNQSYWTATEISDTRAYTLGVTPSRAGIYAPWDPSKTTPISVICIVR